MKIVIQKRPICIEITKGMKIKAYDYDDNLWMDATVIGVDYEKQSVKLKTNDDGLEWEETSMLKLVNANSYNWTP